MTAEVVLPGGRRHRLAGGSGFARPAVPATSRIAYAAAHVVADPTAENVPGAPATVDWDTTLAFRRHLWSYGLGSPRRWTPPSGGWGWTTRRPGS